MSIFMVISGTLCGLEEEAVAFYPIMCPIFIAMGYDAIVTMGVIFLAGFMGVTMSISNPFSVVIASNTAGVPFTEGVWWRIGGCIVGSAVVIGYLYWYAKKIKANPEFSYAWEDRERYQKKWGVASGEVIPFTWRRVLILLLFFAGFPIMVWGVMATLQMLDIKYTHWLKFVWPMVIFVLIFGGALLVAQTMIYGA
ncbi:arginine:ornithine antiporter [Mobiluncus mulieris]|uniref:Arginine:ornithine antiporter n=1 Tax=Mobiluncus mulieris TaxID=2052 RepID=A0A7Y0U107_9ACTO|nr:arginine:ornithine antiporter [Mobiluncus mulieris]MCV0012608.1 arginine:ornithine antiporter [Mobiluncus mulieris]NMW64899.1 arginine:ornithine antiporter [Mobiluncus mulieris]